MQISQSTSSIAGPRWRFKPASSSLGDSSAKNVVLHVLRHCVCLLPETRLSYRACVCVCVCACVCPLPEVILSQRILQEYRTQWKNVNTVQEDGTKQTGKPPGNKQAVGFKYRVPVTGIMGISQNDTRWAVLQFSCVNPHIKYSEVTWRAYEQEIKGGASLAVQWLRIRLGMQGALVGELRSHKPQGN